jgi:hypothetical protein
MANVKEVSSFSIELTEDELEVLETVLDGFIDMADSDDYDEGFIDKVVNLRDDL